jgi:hypothetical protein
LFIFGDADEELLLALAIAVEKAIKEAEDNVPRVTAGDLWESLTEPATVHVNLTTEWSGERKVLLALKRLKKDKLVKSHQRDPYWGDTTLCWNVTDEGFARLADRRLFKSDRPAA